jgi:uncharacterized protein involved in exopolysaccharide biosynthesis
MNRVLALGLHPNKTATKWAFVLFCLTLLLSAFWFAFSPKNYTVTRSLFYTVEAQKMIAPAGELVYLSSPKLAFQVLNALNPTSLRDLAFTPSASTQTPENFKSLKLAPETRSLPDPNQLQHSPAIQNFLGQLAVDYDPSYQRLKVHFTSDRPEYSQQVLSLLTTYYLSWRQDILDGLQRKADQAWHQRRLANLKLFQGDLQSAQNNWDQVHSNFENLNAQKSLLDVEGLAEQKRNLQQDYEKLKTRYGPKHPRMMELMAELDFMTGSLRQAMLELEQVQAQQMQI